MNLGLPPVILASKSARRKELLEMLGVKFEICALDTDETEPKGLSPDALVEDLALRKLCPVRDKIGIDSVVIAADTIVWCKNHIFGKPSDLEEAKFMLRSMSGAMHEVYTGLAVSYKGKTVVEHERTAVCFHALSEREIDSYVHTAAVTDKAGAYGIQERASLFVERIEGDYFNIVGLPVCRLGVILRRDFGIEL